MTQFNGFATGPVAYSIPDTGARLGGLCRASVYRAINRGDLDLVKIGGRSMITARSIEQLLDRNRVSEAA